MRARVAVYIATMVAAVHGGTAAAHVPDGRYSGSVPLRHFQDVVGSQASDVGLPSSFPFSISVKRYGRSYRVRDLRGGGVEIWRGADRYTIRGESPVLPVNGVPQCGLIAVARLGGRTRPALALGAELRCANGYWAQIGYAGYASYRR